MARLGAVLDRAASGIERHVVLSAPAGDDSRKRYFAERGWTAHVKQSRMVRNHKGWQRISNADGLLLFVTGMLAANSVASLILVCSGDGELVEEVAEALYLQGLPLRVATLSLAGSTSVRLDAACSALVAMNTGIGGGLPASAGGRRRCGSVLPPRACREAVVQTWRAAGKRTKTTKRFRRAMRTRSAGELRRYFVKSRTLCESR